MVPSESFEPEPEKLTGNGAFPDLVFVVILAVGASKAAPTLILTVVFGVGVGTGVVIAAQLPTVVVEHNVAAQFNCIASVASVPIL